MTDSVLCFYCAEPIKENDDAIELTHGALQFTEVSDDEQVPWIEFHAGSYFRFCHKTCLPDSEG